MTPVIVISLLDDRQEDEERQREDGRIVSGGRQPRNGLRHTNADKEHVVQSRALEQQLAREEVPEGIPRGSDGIRNVAMAATLVNEVLFGYSSQRDMSAVFRGRQRFLAEDELNEVALVDELSRLLHPPRKPALLLVAGYPDSCPGRRGSVIIRSVHRFVSLSLNGSTAARLRVLFIACLSFLFSRNDRNSRQLVSHDTNGGITQKQKQEANHILPREEEAKGGGGGC